MNYWILGCPLVVLGTLAACQPPAPVEVAVPAIPRSDEQWLRVLRPVSRDSLTRATVHGDTLTLSYSLPADYVEKHSAVLKPVAPRTVRYFRQWFRTPASLRDTVVNETPGQRLRNAAGSVICFNQEDGLLSAYAVDPTCRWENTLGPGMPKRAVLAYYFTSQLDHRLLRSIHTLFLPSGMNVNGTYFQFKGDQVAQVIELELPD